VLQGGFQMVFDTLDDFVGGGKETRSKAALYDAERQMMARN